MKPHRSLRRIPALLIAAAGLAPTVLAASVYFASPNTTVLLGQPYLEFDNPLTGSETVNGRQVQEWRDAGWSCSGVGPPNYEDWSVNPPCTSCSCKPDGYKNEIWLRYAGSSASTVTTLPGTTVSIHLHGDGNDGIADVLVDGALVASVDMFTSPGADNVIIIVDGLPLGIHTITVQHGGTGDVAIMGAAVLAPEFTTYCTAKSGLICGTPSIKGSGTPSATASSGFVVSADPARGCKGGVLLYNAGPHSPGPYPPFQGGVLCVNPFGMRRAGPLGSGGSPGACDGNFSIDMNAFAHYAWVGSTCGASGSQNNPAAYLLIPGTIIQAQIWGRDSVTTGAFLSDGIEWTIGL